MNKVLPGNDHNQLMVLINERLIKIFDPFELDFDSGVQLEVALNKLRLLKGS